MITRWVLAGPAAIIFLCVAGVQFSHGMGQNHRTNKTQSPLQHLPNGPTGPIQQIPLDSMAPVAPRVTYENGQLTIEAANSTMGDILTAVSKQVGVQIEVPEAVDRVVTHLGPGPAREIIAQLLNGSRFNYLLLWSPQDPAVLTRILLTRKAQSPTPTALSQLSPVDVGANPDHHAAIAAPGNRAHARPAVDLSASSNDDQTSADQPLTPSQEWQVQQMQIERARIQADQPQREASPGPSFSVPEIDGRTGLAALAFVLSTILIVRGRREV